MRILALALVTLAVTAVSAPAQIVNGSFSGGPSGWLSGSNDEVSTAIDVGVGNSAPSARITGSGTIFGEPSGSGEWVQSFLCGEAGGSPCLISWQYRWAFSAGVQVRIEVLIDNVTEFFTFVSGTNTQWLDGAVSVPCGPHQIKLRATYVDGDANDDWDVYFDNVFAECDAPVSTDEQSWGTLKAERAE